MDQISEDTFKCIFNRQNVLIEMISNSMYHITDVVISNHNLQSQRVLLFLVDATAI